MKNIENEENNIQQSMKDFEEELNNSLKTYKVGDLVNCTVTSIESDSVIVQVGDYSEGIIFFNELSDDPKYNPNHELEVGTVFKSIVIDYANEDGYLILSKKRADSSLSWDTLLQDKENKKVLTVTTSQVVKGGLVAYIYGVRGFIPASQLSVSYVDDLESWNNKELQVSIIELDSTQKKLILSAKEIEKQKLYEEKQEKINQLHKGMILHAKITKIATYGAFAELDNHISGLIHISQISQKRLKSPNEVLSVGQEVQVKIIDIQGDRIKLSMKDVENTQEETESLDDVITEYNSNEEAATSLASLLKNIKL